MFVRMKQQLPVFRSAKYTLLAANFDFIVFSA